MVDQIELTDFTTLGAGVADGNTFDITHPRITEPCRAAVLLFGPTTTDDAAQTPGRIGIGLVAAGSAPDSSQGVLCRDNLSVPQNKVSGGSAAMLLGRDAAGTTGFDMRNEFDSFIAGGVRLVTANVTADADRLTAKCSALLLAGTSMRSDLVSVIATNASQNANTGGAGAEFRPDLLIVLCTDSLGLLATPAQATTFAQAHLGFVADDGTPTQKCAFVNFEGVTEPSDADGEVRSANGAAGFVSNDRTTRIVVTFGFHSQGFSYQANVTDATNGGHRVTVLAIKFASAKRIGIATFALPGSGGPASFSFGFTPDAVLGMSTLLTTEDSPTSGATAGTFGFSLIGLRDAYARAYSARIQVGTTGVANSDASCQQGNHALLTLDHLGAVAQQASLVGASGAGGFTLNFSTATAGFLTALGIQIIPNPPLPQRRPARRARARFRAPRRPVIVGGKPPGGIVFPHFLREIMRQRRLAQARLRRRPPFPVFTEEVFVGATAPEGTKGRIYTPGVRRGRIKSGPGSDLDQ